jgi:hypothetical protein
MATFPTVIDRGNVVGKAFAVKYVPVGIVIDADGRLARPVSMVDIGDSTFRAELEQWASTGVRPESWAEVSEPEPESSTPDEQRSDACLQQAVGYLDEGDPKAALGALQEAVSLDPENWLIRKQGWAIEAPEVFYNGEVDYEWQKTRIESEIDQKDR